MKSGTRPSTPSLTRPRPTHSTRRTRRPTLSPRSAGGETERPAVCARAGRGPPCPPSNAQRRRLCARRASKRSAAAPNEMRKSRASLKRRRRTGRQARQVRRCGRAFSSSSSATRLPPTPKASTPKSQCRLSSARRSPARLKTAP